MRRVAASGQPTPTPTRFHIPSTLHSSSKTAISRTRSNVREKEGRLGRHLLPMSTLVYLPVWLVCMGLPRFVFMWRLVSLLLFRVLLAEASACSSEATVERAKLAPPPAHATTRNTRQSRRRLQLRFPPFPCSCKRVAADEVERVQTAPKEGTERPAFRAQQRR